ncbi:MAG: peptidoglycan DD-metalloendopeptidase family protein, partial [Planctomycetota bacterium]
PTPGLIEITTPRPGLIHEPPGRVAVAFQRSAAAGLVPSSLELWIDGVEYTESLRFWVDRAWLDLPPGFPWTAGDHRVEARIRDAAGGETATTLDFHLAVPATQYAWPVGGAPGGPPDPSAISNLMEDYQNFQDDPYWHHGLDIRADAGAPVVAAVGGWVGYVGEYFAGDPHQYNVTIVGDDDLIWQYNHVTQSSVQQLGLDVGDRVEAGEPVGEVYNWPGQYDHLHLNACELGGFDPDPWQAQAADPQDTPPAISKPYNELESWRWHNPLEFLADLFDPDTVAPAPDGEQYPNAPAILFLPNESDAAFASDLDASIDVSGDVDIVLHLMDARPDVPGIDGDPYTLGLYEIAYEVEPLGPCAFGWIPYTTLAKFDVIPGGFSNAMQDLYLLDIHQPHVELGGVDYLTQFDWDGRDFFYNVTNTFFGLPNDALGFWDTDLQVNNGPYFPDGQYRVTVHALDFAGNALIQSVDVEVSNDILNVGPCIDDFVALDAQEMELVDPTGASVTVDPGEISVAFAAVAGGSATATIPAMDWPAWNFELPSLGLVAAVGVLEGEEVEVEYVPYLGDVILEIPAEAQFIPWAFGGPAPRFDSHAPSSNPVELRLSTRLARDPVSGEAMIGAPHGHGETSFELVMGTPVEVPGGGTFVLRTSPDGGPSAWTLGPACPADLDGDGMIGVSDLLAVLAAWGTAAGDITGDGQTDVSDLLQVIALWGACG